MTEAEIARLEERRQAEGLVDLGLDHLWVAGGAAVSAGPGSWCNLVSGVGLDGPVSEAELDAIDAFYAGRDVDVRFELSPYADAGLLPALVRRGFVPDRFENLLARELGPEDPPSIASDAGVEVGPARPGDESAIVQLVHDAFHPDTPLSDNDREVGLRLIAHPLVLTVVARAGDQVVGAGHAEVRGPVAALFGAAVAPAWRRRGIQRSLLHARLALATERGARLATIGSIPGEPTERNVSRAGFRVVCTRLLLVRRRA